MPDVLRELDFFRGLDDAALRLITSSAETVFRSPSRLTTSPQSWATNAGATRTSPVLRSTSTSTTVAAQAKADSY